MPEIHGNAVAEGDKILVGSQVARIFQYDETLDRMGYQLVGGNGTDTIYVHVSNTKFELLQHADGTAVLAAADADLDQQISDVKWVSDGAPEEPADTTRVDGGNDQFITGGSTTRNGAEAPEPGAVKE